MDWVALGVRRVLDLHIDVFWAGRKDASALLLRVIALSCLSSCIDNALDEVRDIGPAGVDMFLSGEPPLEHESPSSLTQRADLCSSFSTFILLACILEGVGRSPPVSSVSRYQTALT